MKQILLSISITLGLLSLAAGPGTIPSDAPKLPEGVGRAPATVPLTWDASTNALVVDYHLYRGSSPRHYDGPIIDTLGSIGSAVVLQPGTNYFAVTGVDVTGLETDFSNELALDGPAPAKTNRLLTISVATNSPLAGAPAADLRLGSLNLTNPSGAPVWFRVSITETNY